MSLFELMETHGHEQVAFCQDEGSGLKCIIGIHDTTLGPALGGCRMWPYRSEEEAITDVIRLSQGMTYKSAAMGLNLGGGKSVIIGDPRTGKSEELFRAFGKFVHTLGGRYIAAEDVGTTPDDIVTAGKETPYVAGLPGRSGDPSPFTSFGVYRGMKACAYFVWGDNSLKDKTVAVQGLGNVGYHLAKHLAEEGARLIVADIAQDRVDRAVTEFGAIAVSSDVIHEADCDVFAPCALGAIVNDRTIGSIKATIIAGGANNQLAEARHGDVLLEKGITYAPDFVINGGGVTSVAEEFESGEFCPERTYAKVGKIYDKILHILNISRSERIPTQQAAILMAEERLSKIRRLGRIYLPS